MICCAGDLWTEGALSQIRDHFPGRACGIAWFSEQAAHRLVAAADYLLVPSRFEPCGLVAMHALRYGAVPIAAPVGGLKDTVSPQASCSSCREVQELPLPCLLHLQAGRCNCCMLLLYV